MKRLSCFCKSKLFSLTLFLQLNLLFSLSENHYGDCLSKKCGDFDITYPFYIINQQKSYCGYPGFEVNCFDQRFPLLNISGSDYVIKSISYDSQKFKVVNSVFDSVVASRAICLDSVRNVSWERDIFQFAGHHNQVFLFRNCSKEVIQKNKQNRVKCGGMAVDGNDPKLKDIEKECNKLNVITVPYYKEGVVDVDFNITHTLERGMMLNWKAYNCTACTETGGQCGFEVVNNQFNCYCPDRTHALHCKPLSKKLRLPAILVGTGSASLGIVFVVAVIIFAKRRQRTIRFTIECKKAAKRNQNVEAFLQNYGSLAPKRYTHAEIRKMTNNFKEKLGEGGYGVVYKGQLLEHSRFVAVKKLKQLKADGDDFLNEVVSISRTNHVNIVSLLGFCFEGKKRALVYDFMPNGSLEKFIDSEGSSCQSLPSETLFGIALGIAKGLDYLHRGCNMRILHFDIKPHNILLDKELCPKISDFGLARLCSTNDSLLSLTEARGTIGYIAPEVFCRNFGGVSHKSDVYSYGMMLLDMVCGRKNIVVVRPQQSSEEYFPDWIYHQLEFQEEIDETHEIRNNQEQELRRKMILVGLWCIQSYPSKRPPMNRVIEMLEGPLSLLQMPPKPHLSSTPHSVLDASGTASLTSMEYSIS